MKTKKVIAFLLLGIFALGVLASCAIDRKCPAYSQVPVEAQVPLS